MAEIYAPVLEAVGRRLLVDARGAVPVQGDRRRVRQPLVNLVENAVHHCPAGTTVRMAGLTPGPSIP